MTAQEYAVYESDVRAFFEREGIANLSTGHPTCPECGADWDDNDSCPNGHGHREGWDEPYCSSHGCDCCGNSLQQSLEFATGWNPTTKEVQEYQICEDCAYYAEYGRLDDQTMDEIENN
jgi:hypothetical protein